MAKLAIIIVAAFTALLFTAPASACSDCSTPVELANCTSKRIFQISKVLKNRVHCEFPQHRCALPWFPECEPCIPQPECHEEPQTCSVDREICLEPPCHMPALALRPVECCLCGIELTGTKDLIVVCGDCSSDG